MKRLGFDAELGDAIGAIYDCVLDPSLWPLALLAVRTCIGFHNASVDVFDISAGKVSLSAVSGIKEAYLLELPSHGVDMVRQWGGPARVRSLPFNKPLLLSKVNAQGLTHANPFYAEFDAPEGIIDVMTVRFARDAGTISSVAFGRHRDAGPIGEVEVAAAQILVPHFKRAIAISRRLKADAKQTDARKSMPESRVRSGAGLAFHELATIEARVLDQIAAGRSFAETATALGVSVNTVRLQVRRLFDKTGRHRHLDSFFLPLVE